MSPSQKKDLGKKQKKLCKTLKQQDKKYWTDARLGSLLGRPRETIRDWLNISNGETANAYKKPDARVKLNQPAKDEVAERVAAGESQAQVAKLLGVPRETVRNWLDTPNGQKAKRRKAPDARVKLSQDAKKEVAKRVKAGESQAQVAADFGVSQQHVS